MESAETALSPSFIEKRLKIAGISVSLGMATEAVSLTWAHPTSFFLFLIVGGGLIAAGILLFFYALVMSPTSP